jgi:Fe-S-cluster containining protein
MPDPILIALDSSEPFRFSCSPEIACFNRCCRDLNQLLTPFDILPLKTHLGLSAAEFLARYTTTHTGPATGLPVVTLRPAPTADRPCPFSGDEGCRVYAARPSSCRIYPVVRLLHRCRATGTRREAFALLRDPQCKGFDTGPRWTAPEWTTAQNLDIYNEFNDLLIDLVVCGHRRRNKPDAQQQKAIRLALYDVEGYRRHLETHGIPKPLADHPDASREVPQADRDLLRLGIRWVEHVLKGA